MDTNRLAAGFLAVAVMTGAAGSAGATITLDNTFDADGRAYVNIDANLDGARAVAVQSDGKPVLAGLHRLGTSGSSLDYMALVRLNLDGSLDTTFGTGGIVTTLGGAPATFGGSDARAVVIQPADGKIIAAGYYNQNDGSGNVILVARYSSLGVLDATFGTAGIAKFTIPVMTNFGMIPVGGRANAIALQDDGDIVLAGFLEPSGDFHRAFVLRLNADGTPDAGFATNGAYVRYDSAANAHFEFNQVRLQLDGRIVVAGTNDDMLFVRLTAAGAPDTTFSGDGIASVDFESGTFMGFPAHSTEDARDFALRADGSLVATGRYTHMLPSTAVDNAIVRITSTGDLDTTFGNGAIAGAHLFAATGGSYPFALALAGDESIVIAGLSMSLYQVSPNGSNRLTGPSPAAQAILRLERDSTGRIVGAGEANISGSDYQFAALRADVTALGDGPPADVTPDAFSFVDQAGVARSTVIDSTAVTITGINAASAVSVAGGEYSVGCTGTYTSAAGTIGNGQTLCARHTSAATGATATNTVVTVGGVSDTFTSTTAADDTTPDAFAFTDVTGVAAGAAVVSNTVTIAGINAAAAISVAGGEYSIGCNGTFAAAAGTIGNGQTVCVRHTSAAAASTMTTTTLTIGGVADAFSSTTAAAPPAPGGGGGGGGSLDAVSTAALLLLLLLAAMRNRAVRSPS
jgi:uncharacterized delta-60 repeat protein